LNVNFEAMREEILKILDNYHVELQEAEGITEELLNLHVVSQRSELLDFKQWWNNLPDESDDKLYMTNETIERYLKSSCA